MPAYNAGRTLRMTYEELPKDTVSTVILVDDGSTDTTLDVARQLGLEIFVHDRNYGYGANQKTCYTEALRAGADIVVMVHPDYQYDPTLLPQIIAPIVDGDADVVLGSRLKSGSALGQGMPWWKFIANRFLTGVENVVFGLRLSEYHTGYRAFRREVLETVNFAAELGRLHLRPGDHRAGGRRRGSASARSRSRRATSRKPRRRASPRPRCTASRSSRSASGSSCIAGAFVVRAGSRASGRAITACPDVRGLVRVLDGLGGLAVLGGVIVALTGGTTVRDVPFDRPEAFVIAATVLVRPAGVAPAVRDAGGVARQGDAGRDGRLRGGDGLHRRHPASRAPHARARPRTVRAHDVVRRARLRHDVHAHPRVRDHRADARVGRSLLAHPLRARAVRGVLARRLGGGAREPDDHPRARSAGGVRLSGAARPARGGGGGRRSRSSIC